MRERVLKSLADFIYAYHRWILIAGIIITGLMGYFYTRLELKLSLIDLLNPDDPEVQTFKYAGNNFGTLSFLFLVLESDELTQAKKYAEALAPRLEKHPKQVKRIYYKHDAPLILDHIFYFLPAKELSELARVFEENQEQIRILWKSPGLNSLLLVLDHTLYQILSRGELPESEQGMEPELLFEPINRLIAFLEKTVEAGAQDSSELKKDLSRSFSSGRMKGISIDLGEPYLVAKDKKHLLVLIAPPKPTDDFNIAREFVELVNQELSKLDKEIPGVRHYLTGNAAIMRDDYLIVRADMLKTMIISYTLIMLLFTFSFRNLSSIVFAGLSLAVGLLWAFGTAYLLVGHLTSITAVFGAILIGLGIDYAILILSRYTEERHRGFTIKQALELTLTKTGKGILTGAIATSLAFYSIATGSFRGGYEMGLISGTGILLFFVVMSLFLSSLLVSWDIRKSLKGPVQRKINPRIMRIISQSVIKAPILIFSLLGLFFIFMAIMMPKAKFEYNYLNMEAQDVESVQLVTKIPEWFGLSTNFGMILSEDVEQDRKFVEKLKTKETVAEVDAISNFIPTGLEDKKPLIDKIFQVLEEAEPGFNPETLTQKKFSSKEVEQMLKLLGALSEKLKGIEGLAFLSDQLEIEESARDTKAKLNHLIELIQAQDKAKTAEHLTPLEDELAQKIPNFLLRLKNISQAKAPDLEFLKREHPEVVERFQGKDGKFLIYVYPNREIWNEENMKAVVRDLKAVSPSAMGIAVLFNRILDQLKKDMAKVAVVALLVVFIVILLDYRGLWHTLLTMVPLIFGAVCMVGMMNLLGIKFNFVNIGMLPLIIGISIDYGVYVVHRWIGEGKGINSIPRVIENTGRAVVLSALTTMFGFGSVVFSQWQGLSIMGKTLLIGVGFALIASILLLPAFLFLLEKIKQRRNSSL